MPNSGEDRAVKLAKQLLMECAAEPEDSEWRSGYIDALTTILFQGYGIVSHFVVATYRFEDTPSDAPSDTPSDTPSS